ncbi:hypothetical protein MseVgp116 [Melanoplus sanguinipes entomopoxvirus]|uniref:Uncharacterized protein n=1 Tax=Melanoplus sanguinipes entomopoxvirus TaxID=83191 RepID=Q9YVX6_MSEPV|nr:hypothetical protein MseVgp116 [Melanoplus sanguinipes entomopoxvirus]AAC97802.1 ORF MSV116 hypothetical protein [Melanoplus sanguinipes entomopoxvirus 'O']
MEINFDPIIHKILIEYSKTNINIVSNIKHLYLDFITRPLPDDIINKIGNIPDEDRVFDIDKCFIFRSCIFHNVLIVYSIFDNETVIYSFNDEYIIYDYIILSNILFVILKNKCDNTVINLTIYMENNNYYESSISDRIFNELINDIINDPDDITTHAIKNKENSIPIEKSDIDLSTYIECTENDIIKQKQIRYDNIPIMVLLKQTIIYSSVGTKQIAIHKMDTNDKLIIDHDFVILDIFCISLDHILILTFNNLYLVNLNKKNEHYMNMYEFTFFELISHLNKIFYDKCKDHFKNKLLLIDEQNSNNSLNDINLLDK